MQNIQNLQSDFFSFKGKQMKNRNSIAENSSLNLEKRNDYIEQVENGAEVIFLDVPVFNFSIKQNGNALSQKSWSEYYFALNSLGAELDRLHNYGIKALLPLFINIDYSEQLTDDKAAEQNETLVDSRDNYELNVLTQLAYLAKLNGVDGVLIDTAALLNNSKYKEANLLSKFWNRLNLLTELIGSIKRVCGNDFDIAIRLNATSFVENKTFVAVENKKQVLDFFMQSVGELGTQVLYVGLSNNEMVSWSTTEAYAKPNDLIFTPFVAKRYEESKPEKSIRSTMDLFRRAM